MRNGTISVMVMYYALYFAHTPGIANMLFTHARAKSE